MKDCNVCGKSKYMCEDCIEKMHARLRSSGFDIDSVYSMPTDGGVPVLLNGESIFGCVDHASAKEAVELLRRYWPVARGKLVSMGT